MQHFYSIQIGSFILYVVDMIFFTRVTIISLIFLVNCGSTIRIDSEKVNGIDKQQIRTFNQDIWFEKIRLHRGMDYFVLCFYYLIKKVTKLCKNMYIFSQTQSSQTQTLYSVFWRIGFYYF